MTPSAHEGSGGDSATILMTNSRTCFFIMIAERVDEDERVRENERRERVAAGGQGQEGGEDEEGDPGMWGEVGDLPRAYREGDLLEELNVMRKMCGRGRHGHKG